MKVCISSSRDAHVNLAWEEHLLDHVAPGAGPVLAFYINQGAVVLGRNQNPWREANLAALRRRGLALARRLSGGGTVYHDAGNLNYSLMLPREVYTREHVFGLVLRALAACGVTAHRSGTHSLVTGGLKFSGSAFCFRRGWALHHGTLLVQSDLGALAEVLAPTLRGITTKAVASVPAPVVNLADVVPGLTMDELQAALTRELAAGLESEPVQGAEPEAEAWAPDAARHRSWDWVFGETPSFHFSAVGLDQRPVRLTVQAGRLAEADEGCPGRLELSGVRWERAELEHRLARSLPGVQDWWRPNLESWF